MADLTAVDVLAVVEKQSAGTNQDDTTLAADEAIFLALAPGRTSTATLKSKLQKGGVAARLFQDRSLRRQLHIIEQLTESGDVGQALLRIETLVKQAPTSETATAALAFRDQMYLRQKWRKIGGQKWSEPTSGTWTTGAARAPGSYLSCDQQFSDFILTLEWKSEGSSAQGGIYFWYPGTGDLRKRSYKLHVANDYELRDRPDRFSTGALLGVYPPTANTVLQAGEWNRLELTVLNKRVKAVVNGVLVQEGPLASAEVQAPGYVLVDGEFPGMTYRKILVYEPVPPTPAAETRRP
jgi:hypothetical protein